MCQSPDLSAAIITQNLGLNIFSSSQPLYKLPILICGESFSSTTHIFLAVTHQVKTFYERDGGWHGKVHIYRVYFGLASACLKEYVSGRDKHESTLWPTHCYSLETL